VAVGMLLLAGLTWATAPWVATSRLRVPVQLAASVASVGGAALLAVLDGGVMGPFGAWVLFSMIVLAIMSPPGAFAFLGAVSLAAYLLVAVAGPPAPAGHVVVHLLGCAGVAYLCLRHSGALASLRRRLGEVTRLDPLTGCLNRRGFEERLAAALADAGRHGTPVTLVLLDLDRFKEVNDTFGHHIGDELLAWVSRTLGGALRPYDVVGRLGGDEFAVLLPGTGAADAAEATERLRRSLGGVASASLGHATFPDEAASEEELRHLADGRVYRDKGAHERTLPGPDDVRAATLDAGGPHRARARVSPRERLRRSIADLGRLPALNNTIGLGYVLLFTGGNPHRVVIGLLLGGGLLLGAATAVASGRLSRLGSIGRILLVLTGAHLGLAYAAVLLDGGVTSPMALGLLLPLPVVALATPHRSALPVLVLMSALYVSAGVISGSPGGWFVTMRLAGALAITVICLLRSREAAARRAELLRLSRVDVLTDCLNRRGFEERFEAELARARRTGGALGLLVLDLDGFKHLNDTHGHAAGDHLLCWVGATLRDGVRPADAVGRLGGDEFVVLLPDVTPEAVHGTAERLLTALAARTAASVGHATLPLDGDTFDALYARADGRLYEEKAGRGTRRRPPAPDPRPTAVAS
jgi:diguanylate cyclase (GGDEF)-like protein